MTVLVAVALKSLLIAAFTLALLACMKRRSAAERSWVAHIGLLALVIMAFAPLVLPSWRVEAPALFRTAPAVEAPVVAPEPVRVSAPIAAPTAPASSVRTTPGVSAVAAASAVYAIPAAILLLATLLALARLVALQARAEVVVDGNWLTALARAQKRMGFKHGTALLTSNALPSPISWGLMRPVILLNSRAVDASEEAEAIIAHELAHVARMDWAKLLLARIATALFWFNPLVWLLAREAHQLREETADDAVLAADIVDTDYAQLLVEIARHDCPGSLLGAHGVAPSKSSLARRVARVLDGTSVRGPAGRSFAVGVFVGAVGAAAPLAALTLTPGGPRLVQGSSSVSGRYHNTPAAAGEPAAEMPADLAHMIATGVSTSVASATAAIAPPNAAEDSTSAVIGPDGRAVATGKNGTTLASANGASVVVYPPDAQGRSRVVANAPGGATAVAYADAGYAQATGSADPARRAQKNAVERAVAMKAVGATPEYLAAIKSALPQLQLSNDDLVELRGVGVSPDFIQELARAGYRDVNADDVAGAYAVGVRSQYIRAMAAVGYPRLSLRELTELRAVGVMPADVERFRRAGFSHLDIDQLVQAKTLGLTPEEIRASRGDP